MGINIKAFGNLTPSPDKHIEDSRIVVSSDHRMEVAKNSYSRRQDSYSKRQDLGAGNSGFQDFS